MGKGKVKLPIEIEGIKVENPEKYYEFGEEIGRGKNSVVLPAKHKETGVTYAAKIIKYFDTSTTNFARREYELMAGGNMEHKALPKLHEAYLVRKYLIIIMELCGGKTLLDQVANRHSLTEDDVAVIIRQLCDVLKYLHGNGIVHLDVRPTNIRFSTAREIKLLDYNSGRVLRNKTAGQVVDIIGDSEFCAPELLNFDPVNAGSDMWSVAVIMYILLSGESPYYNEDEKVVLASVESVKYDMKTPAFGEITAEAKDFIKNCFKRPPEKRLTADEALNHKWLSPSYEGSRKRSVIKAQDTMKETDERLFEEEEEEYIEASLVFRTFDEEEYESPEEDSEEEDEGGEKEEEKEEEE